jgi:hypothetical protein
MPFSRKKSKNKVKGFGELRTEISVEGAARVMLMVLLIAQSVSKESTSCLTNCSMDEMILFSRALA